VLVMAAVFTSRLRRVLVLYLLTLFAASIAAGDGWTHKHEAGRCAIRGHCGKKSLFGKELPCPDNGPAEEPDDDVRKKLVDICGVKWSEGPVCCRGDQVRRIIMPSLKIHAPNFYSSWPLLTRISNSPNR
jgi:Niemann-Pick C1 N terminus